MKLDTCVGGIANLNRDISFCHSPSLIYRPQACQQCTSLLNPQCFGDQPHLKMGYTQGIQKGPGGGCMREKWDTVADHRNTGRKRKSFPNDIEMHVEIQKDMLKNM
jgi:hypothetical protein